MLLLLFLLIIIQNIKLYVKFYLYRAEFEGYLRNGNSNVFNGGMW